MKLYEAFEYFINNRNLSHHSKVKYRSKIGCFVEKYGHLRVDQIKYDHVNAWFLDRTANLSDPTRAMHRSCILSFFNEFRPRDNPATGIPRYSDRPRRIILPDEVAVKAAFSKAVEWSNSNYPIHRRDALIFALSVATGARRGELQSITLDEMEMALDNPQVDDQIGAIYTVYSTGKTGEAVLSFTNLVANFAHRYLELRPRTKHNRLFISFENRHYGRPLGENAFMHSRKRLCKAAGIPSSQIPTFQQLRRLKATQVSEKFGIEVAALVLGHSSTSGTRVVLDFYCNPQRSITSKASAGVFFDAFES